MNNNIETDIWFDPKIDTYYIKFRRYIQTGPDTLEKQGFMFRITNEYVLANMAPIPETGEYPMATNLPETNQANPQNSIQNLLKPSCKRVFYD